MKKFLFLSLLLLFISTNSIFAADLDRLYDFETISATTKTIVSVQVDAEFDQLVAGHNQQETTIANAGTFSGIKGSENTASLEDGINNEATNDSHGHIDGCFFRRNSSNGSFVVTAGSVAIGNDLYNESSDITVTSPGVWSPSGTTGGIDSGTSLNNNDFVYVFLTTTTADPDGWQILLSENTSPNDVTPGVNARLVAGFLYKTAVGIETTKQYRPWGIIGWNYLQGDGIGTAVLLDINHGVTFKRIPYMTVANVGYRLLSSGDIHDNNYDDVSGYQTGISFFDTTTTTYSVIGWYPGGVDVGADELVIFGFCAYGDWTI